MTFFQKQADDARPYGYSSAEVEAHTVERHAGRRMSETEHAIVHAMIGADHRHHYAETGALALTVRTEPDETGV